MEKQKITSESAYKRCKGCKSLHSMTAINDRNFSFLGCGKCKNKWIVEIEQCPLNK